MSSLRETLHSVSNSFKRRSSSKKDNSHQVVMETSFSSPFSSVKLSVPSWSASTADSDDGNLSTLSFKSKRKKKLLKEKAEQKESNAEAKAESMNAADLLDGESSYPMVCGVLAVKVVSAEVRQEADKDSYIFTKLHVRNLKRYTGNAKRWGSRLSWNEMCYFPVRVIPDPKHPFNLFQISIFSVPHYLHVEEEVNYEDCVVGSVPFHMHDLVKGCPSMGTFTILKGHRPVGSITLEMYFTYGTYGYGYSPQFKHSEDVENQLEFSMLPRCVPSNCEPQSQTCRVFPNDQNAKLLDEREHEKDFPLLHGRMTRYHNLKEKYDQIEPRARLDKLAFLYKQINSTSKSQNGNKSAPFVDQRTVKTRNSSFFQKYMNPTLQSN